MIKATSGDTMKYDVQERISYHDQIKKKGKNYYGELAEQAIKELLQEKTLKEYSALNKGELLEKIIDLHLEKE